MGEEIACAAEGQGALFDVESAGFANSQDVVVDRPTARTRLRQHQLVGCGRPRDRVHHVPRASAAKDEPLVRGKCVEHIERADRMGDARSRQQVEGIHGVR